MQPGTPHHVISTEDTIAVGGHFFSSLLFSRTLEAMIAEHFASDFLTNTEHSEVHIVLFKMLRKFRDGLEKGTS